MNDKIYEKLNTTLTVAGKGFACQCGCNVFAKLKLKDDKIERYECNSCKEKYKAV